MREVLTGMVIGNEENMAIVKSNKGLVFIPENSLGGEERRNKARNFIGSIVSFCLSDRIGERQYGDRKEALTQMRTDEALKVGDTVSARVLVVFAKSLLVMCKGLELYIPVERCLPYWIDNMQASGEFNPGDEIEVDVESVDPVELRVRFSQDISNIALSGNYLGEVKSVIDKGSFIQLLISNTIVHCRPVDWRKALVAGDFVTIEVTKIEEEKHRVFGIVKRRNGRM